MPDFPGTIRVPRSVMIGSTARNTGKTEFACALIRSLGRNHPVHAAKVTTIYEGRTTCVRGGEGCGVCTSMEGDLMITEELDRERSKDTSRMLAAGAERVWWLRVREGCVAAAAHGLAGMVPPGGVLVFESNSLRKVCEPDLFFMLGNPARGIKESARAVLNDADRIVASDGSCFDFEPENVSLSSGRCVFPRDAGAIVLAGGRSTRMGTDKRFLDIDGLPLVEHVYRQLAGTFPEILLSVADESGPAFPFARRVTDRHGDAGPMGGVASALEASVHETNFVTACDIPSIPIGFVQAMLRLSRHHQVVVPVDGSGRYEPLFAVYSKTVLPPLLRLLKNGERRIRMLYDLVDTCRVTLPAGTDIRNLNTKDDYLSFMAG